MLDLGSPFLLNLIDSFVGEAKSSFKQAPLIKSMQHAWQTRYLNRTLGKLTNKELLTEDYAEHHTYLNSA
jgi:hypothetical protein